MPGSYEGPDVIDALISGLPLTDEQWADAGALGKVCLFVSCVPPHIHHGSCSVLSALGVGGSSCSLRASTVTTTYRGA